MGSFLQQLKISLSRVFWRRPLMSASFLDSKSFRCCDSGYIAVNNRSLYSRKFLSLNKESFGLCKVLCLREDKTKCGTIRIKCKPFLSLILKLTSLLILTITTVLTFPSCSNAVPEVLRTDCTVVLTYEENTAPESRLSVFVQSGTDVRRCQRIKVHSLSSKYKWETDDIKKIAMGSFQWAGNGNFLVPEGEKIPQGQYEITYINADEEQQIAYASLKYDEKLYKMKSDEISLWMTDKGNKNLAVFDSNNLLLFLGEPTEEFSTSADILERYNNASYYKEVWIAYDNSVICILPKNQL